MMMTTIMKRFTFPIAFVAMSFALTLLVGCVEQSDTVVTFDEVLESTTFENRLLAPVVLYRDNVFLDTLPASTTRTYALGRRGPVRHGWRLVAPFDRFGRKASIEPQIDLGVQYELRGHYRIDNDLKGKGIDAGRTIFTPIVGNFTNYSLRLIANYREDDQVYTDYLIPRTIDSTLRFAPYFFWHSTSNIRLESIQSRDVYDFTRQDTGRYELKMDDTRSEYSGTGRTYPVTVN